jgi:predicted dehydrogenase
MRIGMIGTGWITPQHMDAIVLVPGAEIVAVAGRDPAKAEAVAKPHKAKAYGDWSAMVARERLDAVYICLAPSAAAEVARGCAGKVRGVMVEKPVDADLASAEKTVKSFAAAGTIAGAAYHNRVRAFVPRIRALCAAKPVVVADAWWHGGMPGPLWWRTRAQSGGQMSEQCTHLVDLMRVWMGEAVEVTATAAHGTMKREIPDFDVDDAVTATIRFASGAIATAHTSCIAQPNQEIDSIGLVLRARGWQAQLSGWGLDAQIRRTDGPEENIDAEKDVYRLQAEAFFAAIAANDPGKLPCTFADGVETLRLTRAIDQAAATGKPQRVD